MKAMLGLSLVPVLVAASPVLHTGTIHEGAAPILSTTNAKEIPNSYIVVFKKHVDHSAASDHHEWVQNLHLSSEQTRMELRKRSLLSDLTDAFEGLKHTYTIGDLLGYSGHFDENLVEEIRRHPDVSAFVAGLISVSKTFPGISFPCS